MFSMMEKIIPPHHRPAKPRTVLAKAFERFLPMPNGFSILGPPQSRLSQLAARRLIRGSLTGKTQINEVWNRK